MYSTYVDKEGKRIIHAYVIQVARTYSNSKNIIQVNLCIIFVHNVSNISCILMNNVPVMKGVASSI